MIQTCSESGLLDLKFAARFPTKENRWFAMADAHANLVHLHLVRSSNAPQLMDIRPEPDKVRYYTET